MEIDFVLIDRSVVYITERRCCQFFLGVFSGLSSTVFSFIYQDNLLKRTMALWSPKRIENYACIYLIPRLIASYPVSCVRMVRCRHNLNAWNRLITSK